MLSYKSYGVKKGIPLVMIHGYLCGGDFFKPNIKTLQNHYWIITIDLPGFGDSHSIKAIDTIKEMAQETIRTLAILGIDKFHLLGHSMGGMVVLQMTLLAVKKIKSLIVYASNYHGYLNDRFETFDESANRLKTGDFSQIKLDICSTWFKQGVQHPHFNLCAKLANKVTLETALYGLQAMKKFDLTKEIKKINCPVKIIAAQLDKTYAIYRLEEMHNLITNSSLTIMKNCSHNAHLEQPHLFNSIVLDFLP